MAEKKPNPLKEAILAYRERLEKMSPEERAKQEALEEAFAKKYLRLINDNLDDFES